MLTPDVGDTVIFHNRFGHPRAAIVVANRDSLEGEKHAPMIVVSHHLHLFVMSPLQYTRFEMHVPSYEALYQELLEDDPLEISRAYTWTSKDSRV